MAMAAEVRLPGGLWQEGGRLDRARVRALTGADEEAVAARATDSAASLTTELLSRCVVVADATGPRADVMRSLSVGDREALLWHLRRITFGPVIDAVVDCGACGEKLDLTLDVFDLVQDPYPDWPPEHTEAMAGHMVTFRVPTGADTEAIAGLARADPAAAGRALAARCVSLVDGLDVTDASLDEVRPAVSERLAALDPQAETVLAVACPECAGSTDVLLDAAGYLVEEVTRRAQFLYEEIHTLAWYYHWSEHDILSMPAPRRHRYLELIESSLGRGVGP
jgi:hypothetical protein